MSRSTVCYIAVLAAVALSGMETAVSQEKVSSPLPAGQIVKTAPCESGPCVSSACGCSSCGSGCCRCCENCASCQMPQHYPYPAEMHGYYYLLPYHHSHLRLQQSFVASWGGDPRAPYANEIFEQVYSASAKDKSRTPPPPTPLKY
jgi:hypothetical protein